MSTYNVLNAGSREVLNLDGALTKEDAEQLAYEIERNSDIECEVVNASDRTEEYAITDEDRLVIEWDGEARTIRTFTRGTPSPLYVGDSLDAAAESLEITREQLDEALMGDAVVRDRDGNEIDR